MNSLQICGMTNCQTAFNGYNKPTKTLADVMKQEKIFNKRIINLSKKYGCTPAVMNNILKIDKRTTAKQIKAKVLYFEKNMEELLQRLKKGLEEENIKADNTNIIIV